MVQEALERDSNHSNNCNRSSISYSCCCVATGGMALVLLLTTVLPTFGVSAGLATTIATITSLSVATIAILSTLGSSTLNIIDTWGNIDNSVFNTFQNVLNWTSTISNCFYSIGSIL